MPNGRLYTVGAVRRMVMASRAIESGSKDTILTRLMRHGRGRSKTVLTEDDLKHQIFVGYEELERQAAGTNWDSLMNPQDYADVEHYSQHDARHETHSITPDG